MATNSKIIIARALALVMGLVSLVWITSCASISRLGQGSDFKLRQFQEVTLENGLKILAIKDDSLPRLSFNLMIQVGSLYEPATLSGLNNLTAGLLDQGTSTRSAEKLAEEFNQLGTELSQSADVDMTMVSLNGLSTNSDELLNLFSDVVKNPAFAQKEIDRARANILAGIQKQVDKPSSYANLVLAKEIYGAHPYSRSSVGSKDSVKKINRTDIVKHYFKYYRPNNSILAISGKFDENFLSKVKLAFGDWKKNEVTFAKIDPAQESSANNVILYSKAGLKQAEVRLAHLGVKRSHPDFLKLRVANMILGGSFASRLNQKVRDDLGLTYSIGSMNDTRFDTGIFEISTFTRQEKIFETISESKKVYADFVDKGIKQIELDGAKNLLIGQFPAALETVDRFAYNLLYLRRQGLSDDYLRDYIKNVRALSLSDVNEAIKKTFKPGNLKTVVYGDEKQTLESLKKLGSVEIKPAGL